MGAFLSATMSMFVSCKDYDDDINANATEIQALKTQLTTLEKALEKAKADAAAAHATFATKGELEALKTEMAKLVTAEQLQKAIDECKALIDGKADKDAFDALVAKVNGIDDNLNTLTGKVTTLEQAIAAAKANLEAQGYAFDKLGDALKNLDDTKADKAEVEKQLKELRDLVGVVKDATEAAKTLKELKKELQDLNDAIDKHNRQINVLTVLINKRLSALVFQPSFYWEGLASIELPAIFNTATYGFDGKTSFTYKVTGAQGYNTIKITVDNKPDGVGETTIMDGAIARYHVDPTSASFKDAKFSFFVNEAEVYTRGGEPFVTPKKETFDGTVNYVKDGVLTVPFKADFAKLKKYYMDWVASANPDPQVPNNMWYDQAHGQGSYGSYGAKLPFIALQTTFPETTNEEIKAEAHTVTSDYALLTPAEYRLKALADNGPDDLVAQGSFDGTDAGLIGQNHLYTTFFGVDGEEFGRTLADAQTHGVLTMPATHAVEYDKTIDLKPFIETHADYLTFAKYGKAKHDFVMSDEQLEALGLKYKFTVVDYWHGEEKTSESAHIEQIENGVFAPRSVTPDGKTITGKVATREVIDREPLVRVDLVDENNNVVLYGYIKLRIVEVILPTKVEAPLNEIYMNCGDKGKMTWSQVEALILSKIGGKGMTKQEFENNYYLEVKDGKTVMPTMADGALYTDGWQAIRYGGPSVGEKLNDQDAAYGRVWYTPHDNATDPLAWDAQTNVLEWNLTDDPLAGAMNAAKYEQFMKDYDVTYASKGENLKEASTWVRFIGKNNRPSIWVKLYFAPHKIHFEYGKVANKDLGHWYKFNSAYEPGTQSDLDVHANVPTPAEVNKVDLTNDKFDKDLREYWVDKKLLLELEGPKDKFTEFYNADGTVKTQVDFEFTLPKKGVNSTINATSGTWVVEGASGSKWTLKLADNNHKIFAIAQDGNAINDELVAELRQNIDDGKYSILHYFGDETDNRNAATDLINKMGRRNAKGEDIMKDYLTDNIDKTFTIYVEVKASHDPCYAPLLANNFFNVRMLRPINVWPVHKTWTDALNQTETLKLEDLVKIKDWRDYNVEVGATFAEGKVPYSYYGITDLSIIREHIRSDHQAEASVRQAPALTDPAEIVKLPSVEKIPSLTSYKKVGAITTTTYLKLKNAAGTEVYENSVHGTSGNGWTEGDMAGKKYGTIEYTNNGGGVQDFHIYVPIAVKYNWGNVIKKRTKDSTSGVKKDLNYTQVVWTVITVKKTTGSGGAKKN